MPIVTRSQLAELANVTDRQINLWVKKDDMPVEGRGAYDAVKCIHWLLRKKDEQIEFFRRGGETESSARIRLLRANANLREIELARIRVEVILIDDAIRSIADVMKAMQTRLLAIPKRSAPQLVGIEEPGEIESFLTVEIHQALNELSRVPDSIRSAAKVPRAGDPQDAPPIEAPAKAHRRRLGRRKSHPKPRGKRRARPVAHKPR
jgi:phage terminase Nu1 subunit (DNA packaging protein)